jgi:hypothetical protein
LEQIIQSIQQHIDGVVIHPVSIDKQEHKVVYVVEIPQSGTAHQARDHVYYKRHNFNVLPMEDYEVRDVMNRKTHPKIRGSVRVRECPVFEQTFKYAADEDVLVKLENVGRVLAHNVMVELELHVEVAGIVAVQGPSNREDTEERLLRLTPGPGQAPIFPGSQVILRRTVRANARITDDSGQPATSTGHVKVSVFADEMPPLKATLNIARVISGWTPLEVGGPP